MSQAIDQLCINTIRALSMDAVQKANSRPSRGAHGRLRRRRTFYGRAFSNTTRQIPIGRIATASCSRRDTARCCFTACSISPATTCRSNRSSNFASGGAARPAIPSASSRRAWRRPPARLARASATASAWRWRKRTWRRATTARASTIVDHFTYGIVSDGDLMEGVASEAASLAGHLQTRQARSIFTTTIGSRSPARPI